MMTKAEAIENVNRMKAETPTNAMVAVLKAALKRNRLTDDARAIYQAELESMS